MAQLVVCETLRLISASRKPGWWHTPVNPALRKGRKEEDQKFKATLTYVVSLRPAGLNETLFQKKKVNAKWILPCI